MQTLSRSALRATWIAASIALAIGNSSLAAQTARSLQNYGVGTPGTGGFVPDLWATTTPRPGANNFGFTIGRGNGGGAGAILLAVSPLDADLFGLRLLVDPSVLLASIGFQFSSGMAGSGSASVALPLAVSSTGLLGVPLVAQALAIDPAGGFVGLSASRGLRFALQAPELLLATRSIGGSTDPVTAIDVASGNVVDMNGGRVDNGSDVEFLRDGSLALVCSGMTDSVEIYDASVFPPTSLTGYTVGAGTTPWSITLNPDTVRGYVVTQGPSGTTPLVEVVNVLVGDPQFGTAFPGGSIDPGSISAMDILFSPDGDVGYLSSLGIGGPASVTRYDTRLGSSTYHQATGALGFAGQFVFDTAITHAGDRLFVVAANLGSLSQIAVVDTATMTTIDWDPGAPGVQSIGGELSVPATPLGRVLGDVLVDPRDRFLYCAVWGSVANTAKLVRVDIDPTSPGYRQVTTFTSGFLSTTALSALAIDDAGSKLFLADQDGDAILEIDATSMTLQRTFAVPPSPNQLALR